MQACKVMESFQVPAEALRLRDVVARTGLPKGTVFRLLYTLHSQGFVEKTGQNQYRLRITLPKQGRLRLGFAMAGQTRGFGRIVADSLVRAAQSEGSELIILDNKDSGTALRNADFFIREHVQIAIEFQGDPSNAEMLSAKLLGAGIPLIAVDVPLPGAAYFGANNYQVGIIGGRAMGRWVKLHWGRIGVDVVLVGETGPSTTAQSRIKGMLAGLSQTWEGGQGYQSFRFDGSGDFESSYEAVRKHLSRAAPRETLVGAINDAAALGAIQAFREAGRQQLCAVMGCNAEPEACAEMRLPGTRMIGSVGCFPERYGPGILSLAKTILNGSQATPVVFMRHSLLTPANVSRIYSAPAI